MKTCRSPSPRDGLLSVQECAPEGEALRREHVCPAGRAREASRTRCAVEFSKTAPLGPSHEKGPRLTSQGPRSEVESSPGFRTKGSPSSKVGVFQVRPWRQPGNDTSGRDGCQGGSGSQQDPSKSPFPCLKQGAVEAVSRHLELRLTSPSSLTRPLLDEPSGLARRGKGKDLFQHRRQEHRVPVDPNGDVRHVGRRLLAAYDPA